MLDFTTYTDIFRSNLELWLLSRKNKYQESPLQQHLLNERHTNNTTRDSNNYAAAMGNAEKLLPLELIAIL